MLRPVHKPPLLAQANEGSICIATQIDFTASATANVDITGELEQGKLGFVQSVYIDNADNSTVCDLLFLGGPRPHRVRALPNSQGWYAVAWPVGAGHLVGLSNSGAKIDVIFANFPMPYFYSAPTPGVTVVPPLTNVGFQPLNFAGAGNSQLVAGAGAQTVKLYRGIFNVDAPVTLLWTDGPGGATLFSAFLTLGGSATFQAAGVPWFNAGAGHDLTLHASAACNVYGGFGYVQS